MKYHTLSFSKIKMSQNLLSAAVVTSALRVNQKPDDDDAFCRLSSAHQQKSREKVGIKRTSDSFLFNLPKF